MDNSGQRKEVPVRLQSESQTNVHIPASEAENFKDDPCQPKDEPVNKARSEPIQVFAVDKKVLEGAAIGIPKEATVWDVYNNEAKKADDELVKDWRDNLGSLLLFAAIFAAVLTAFIIESKKMLEQDQTELLVNVMVFGINNMGNLSKLPFVPPTFVPTSTAISINCCLFASLGTSLVAALAAVVSLQWVADYDAAITRGGSSPEDRAKRRQFRFAGVLTWKMGGIIASLPLLLYSSVALFWAGAIQWMLMLHPSVGYVVAGGTAMALIFYVSTTLLAAISVWTPFKTPLSRGVYWVHQSTIYLVRKLLSCPLARAVFPEIPTIRFPIKFAIVATARLVFCVIILPVRIALLAIIKIASWLNELGYLESIKERLPPWVGIINRYFKEVLSSATSHQPRITYRQREDRAAAEDPSLTQQALAWLADQIISSTNSNSRLQLLVDEVVKQSPNAQSPNSQSSEATLSGSSTDTSWLKIFDSLGWHYLRKILDGTLSENDHETVGFLVRRSRTPGIWDRISRKDDHEDDPIQPTDWCQYSFDTTKVAKSQAMESVSMAFLLARDVPIPSSGSGHELRLTIRLIKWRNSGVRERKYPYSDVYSSEYLRSYVQYLKHFLRFANHKYYSLDDSIPLWSLSKDEGVGRELLVDLLEDFDKSVAQDKSAKKHSTLVGIIIKDIARSYERWPGSPTCPADLSRRLAEIQDPCLALLGNVAAGVPTQRELTLLTSYIESYSDSLDLLPFQNLSSDDSPTLWRLRASLWPVARRSREHICSMALKHPQYMRIFKYPVSCQDHSTGSHHLLYHLCMDSGRLARFPEQTTLFGDGCFEEYWISFILAFLALPEDQPVSNITPFGKVPTDCIEGIGAMCQAVKEEPTSRLALLTDIAQSHSFNYYYAANVAAILECTQHIPSIADHGSFTHLLRSLACGLRHLSKNMLTARRVDVTEGERHIVAAHADRICRILETKGDAPVISSSAQLLSLSCARPCLTGQPAVGWMAMHAEV